MAPECIAKYNELKLSKQIKYIIYKLSDDYKEIVIEETSTDADWEKFQSKLMNAKSGHRGKEGKGPRFAVYDFQYELEGGEGTRYGDLAELDVKSSGEEELICLCEAEIRSPLSRGVRMRELLFS